MKRPDNRTAVNSNITCRKALLSSVLSPSPLYCTRRVFPKRKDKQCVLSAFSLGQGSACGQGQHELACPARTLTLALRLASLKP